MITVYAFVGGVISQIVARFMFTGPTLKQLPKAFRKRPVYYAFYYIIMVGAPVAFILEDTGLSSYIPNSLTVVLAYALVLIIVNPWVVWVNRQISDDEINTKSER